MLKDLSYKHWINIALKKANSAVEYDTSNDFQNAISAYTEAVQILRCVLQMPHDQEAYSDTKGLDSICNVYIERIEFLTFCLQKMNYKNEQQLQQPQHWERQQQKMPTIQPAESSGKSIPSSSSTISNNTNNKDKSFIPTIKNLFSKKSLRKKKRVTASSFNLFSSFHNSNNNKVDSNTNAVQLRPSKSSPTTATMDYSKYSEEKNTEIKRSSDQCKSFDCVGLSSQRRFSLDTSSRPTNHALLAGASDAINIFDIQQQKNEYSGERNYIKSKRNNRLDNDDTDNNNNSSNTHPLLPISCSTIKDGLPPNNASQIFTCSSTNASNNLINNAYDSFIAITGDVLCSNHSHSFPSVSPPKKSSQRKKKLSPSSSTYDSCHNQSTTTTKDASNFGAIWKSTKPYFSQGEYNTFNYEQTRQPNKVSSKPQYNTITLVLNNRHSSSLYSSKTLFSLTSCSTIKSGGTINASSEDEQPLISPTSSVKSDHTSVKTVPQFITIDSDIIQNYPEASVPALQFNNMMHETSKTTILESSITTFDKIYTMKR